MLYIRIANRFFLAFAVLLLAACSGSDATAPSMTQIEGTVFAAPVSGAAVTVTDMGGNPLAGPVTTDGDGSFTVRIPDSHLASDLVFESTGGTFADEATGAVTSGGSMSVIAEGGSLDASDNRVCATPGTTVVHALVAQHGMSLAAARQAYLDAFGYTPDASLIPVSATVAPESGTDTQRVLAGLRAAAFSQLTMDLGLPADRQFELLQAIALDLSDDTLDGVAASGPVVAGSTPLPGDIRNRFTAALLKFHAGSNNKTGLNHAQLGRLPFARIVHTDSYRVEYRSMMMERQGKSTFTIDISNLADGTPVTTLTPGLTPMMYMADRQHSTPYIDFSNNNDGSYTASVYYLMPSVMMTGDSMGYWELDVKLDSSETARFYPAVMMAMAGNTTRAQLKGVADQVRDMNGDLVARTYNLFRDDLVGPAGSDYRFDVFIAPMETMMSFPALTEGMTLQSGMGGTPYDVYGINVEASIDGGSNWVAGTDAGSGVWRMEGLALESGANEIRIKLGVSGETKTTTGDPNLDSDRDYATFTVTLP